jgi:hypothetical protein
VDFYAQTHSITRAFLSSTINNNMADNASDDDDNDVYRDNIVYTTSEIRKIGLRLVGYKKRWIKRASTKTNIQQFQGHFGSNPNVCAQIWEDLQTAEVEDARVPSESRQIKYFLMAMHHLKGYPTELEHEALFDISAMWGLNWCWHFLEKVQALKAQKITWPDNNFGEDDWILTVDGMHC